MSMDIRAQKIKQFLFSDRLVPFLFLAVLILTFGVFIHQWGFYFDDWPMIYLISNHGDIQAYYQIDRPFLAWTDIVLKTILGVSPLAWQAACFLARWATVVAFWLVLRLVWPKARYQALGAAMLFAVYPVFFQQPIAVIYTHAFISYAAYLLSVALMVAAVRRPHRFALFTLPAMLLAGFHVLSIEYYWGLELLRPLLLWVVVSEERKDRRSRIRKAFLHWSPYLVILAGIAIWRFAFVPLDAEANSPAMLIALAGSPLTAIRELLQTLLRDVSYVVAGTWAQTIDPEAIDLDVNFFYVSCGLAVLTAVIVGSYCYYRDESTSDAGDGPSTSWMRQALLVGLAAIILSMLPAWAAGRQVTQGYYSDRFALPAMVGASLVVFCLIHLLTRTRLQAVVIFAMLIGLSAGTHVRLGNVYRWEWTHQQRFLWQLYWRAPAIQPQTALLSEESIFDHTVRYSIATAINTLYPVPEGTSELPYWVFELDDLAIEESEDPEAIVLQDDVRTLSFTSPIGNSLVVSYQTENPHCLWVLSEADAINTLLPPHTQSALSLSDLDRIEPEPADLSYPDPVIFGPEPAHGWCYFYEKADLARQLGDWETVSALGDEAFRAGLWAHTPYELFPFIEGYIHTRDWDPAEDLSLAVFRTSVKLQPALCALWARSVDLSTLSPADYNDLETIQATINCTAP